MVRLCDRKGILAGFDIPRMVQGEPRARYFCAVKTDRLLPHSPEAEQAVLGCLLLADCRRELTIAPSDFYDLRHAVILEAILALDGAPDPITLQQALKDRGRLEEVGGLAYLATLGDKVPSSANLSFYCDIVREKARMRNAVVECQKIADLAQDFRGTMEEFDWAVRSALQPIVFGSKRSDIPPIADAATFCDFPKETPPQIIKGILHRACKMAIGGGSKTNKTWCFLDLVLSVSHNSKWLGLEVSPAHCCYINLELPEWSLQHRLAAVARAKGITIQQGRLRVWNLRGHICSYREMLPFIAEELRDQELGLIVIDPIYKIYGNLDENKAGDIAQMLNELERLAQQTQASIAFAAHFSKGNQASKEVIDRISGSGVFARDPDAILTLTKHEEDGAFVIDSTLRNCAPMEPFVVRWNYPLLHRADELDPTKLKQPNKGRQPQYSAKDVVELLTAPMKPAELHRLCQEECGMSQSVFFRMVKLLKKTGAIIKCADGKLQRVEGKPIPTSPADETEAENDGTVETARSHSDIYDSEGCQNYQNPI